MERIIHELVQKTDAWLQFRLDHDGASEAAPMLGLSKNVTRSELLRVKHSGIAKEFSDFVQERILDHGHEVEALARPLAEALIGDELYPCTYSYGQLSASCDGLNMVGSKAWECKQWNKEHAAMVARGELPEAHMPQCQQVLLVTGAESLLFTITDGTPEHFEAMTVRPDKAWQDRIVAGWEQFHVDLDTYQPVEVLPPAVAAPTMALPALSIQVNGSISLIDNLALFGKKLTEFIEGIDRNPSTDQSFADAEAAVKTLQAAQEALEAAEANALAQTADIDTMRRTVKLYADQARTTRLMLEKLVKVRKETIRLEIVQGGKTAFAEHVAALNKRLGVPYMPNILMDFPGVIKGKKTVASLRDAVDTELARAKIEANRVADNVQINLGTLRDLARDHAFLFSDAAQIVLKAPDDLTALVHMRLNEHRQAEAKRIEQEREKIRLEEVAKLEAANKAEADRVEKERLASLPTEQPKAAAAQMPEPVTTGGAPIHSKSSAPAAAPTPIATPQTESHVLQALIHDYTVDMTVAELEQVVIAIDGILAARRKTA